MELVRPSLEHLSSYTAALGRGWSPNTLDPDWGQVELRQIAADPAAFVASLDDPSGSGEPVVLPDGSTAPRLPGYRRWIWDGEVAGSINLRWQPGTAELPPYVSGHLGYAVVPWRRGEGLATAAVRALLPDAKALGLPYVELVTDEGNVASHRVITNNGGVRVDSSQGAGPAPGTVRWRIAL